ncbi:MAG: hypothetical protein ACK504_12985 [Bacteroidota bacterium]|jgi:hypothetical protein
MKKNVAIIVILFLGSFSLKAQFTESKERKKMWRKSARSHKTREAFNPYLEKKGKDKPSSLLNKENAKQIKRMNKAARRQKRRSMRKLGIKPTKVKKD